MMKKQEKWLSFFVATHLVFITTLASAASIPKRSNFTCGSLSGCTCPGETYTCQCTIDRSGTTVWNGTLIQGSNGECPEGIVLYRDYTPSACGGFIARGIHISDGASNTFTSQMNLTISNQYNGKTIECSLFSNGVLTLVGRMALNFTVVSLPPPQDVRLSNVTANQLEFSWSPVSKCSTISYTISSSEGCGQCTTNISSTNAKCSMKGLSESVSTCTFNVRTLACGHQLGIQSRSLTIYLKLPDAPVIKELQESHDFRLNRRLYLKFKKEEDFTVFEGFDGSVVSYTISYSDSLSGTVCGSVIILASSCRHKFCSHVFDAFNSSCSYSAEITVTVFGTNAFGVGPVSTGQPKTHLYGSGDTGIESEGHHSILVMVIFVAILVILILLLQLCRYSTKLKYIRAATSNHRIQELNLDSLSNFKVIDETTTLIYESAADVDCNMVEFAKKELPGYKPEWGCGYYQFIGTKDLRCNVKVILKKQDNNRTLYQTTCLKHLLCVKQNDYSVRVRSPKAGEGPIVFIESRDHEENLKSKQFFLFCVPLKEVKGHHEIRKVETKVHGQLLSDYGKTLKFFREGFGYYEYTSDSQDEPKENKTVMLFIEDKLYQGLGSTCLLHPEKALYLENSSKWKHMFIHSSGFKRRVVKETHFMFCIEMDEVTTSYCVYAKVREDSQMLATIEREGILHYQEKYLYYEMHEATCIKRYKKVILMDKKEHMFTGNGVHHFIGRKQSAEKIEVPDFRGTQWTHVFIQSKMKKRILPKNSYFLYCAPLYPIDAYFDLYNVDGQPWIVEFAKKRIPGFNLLMGFGYYELSLPKDELLYKKELKLTSKIIIMSQGVLYVGPGAYHYAVDLCGKTGPKNRLDQQAPQNFKLYMQITSDRILQDGTKFLYCEYEWK